MNTASEIQNYTAFMRALTELSRKHGVVIQAVGGVYLCDPSDVADLTYITDISSGDLLPHHPA